MKLGLLTFAFMMCTTTASAQLVFTVCAETCPNPLTDPVGATACHTRIALCETKLTLYNGYMGQLGTGATRYALPALYRDVLQPIYWSGTLANWRFAFGDRQPPRNATTDCNVTYFNDPTMISDLRNATIADSTRWNWLFHELRHFTQCSGLGSRDAYAKMWFGHLDVAFLQNNNLETIHNRMIMESDAASTADRVMTTTRTMRDINNRLVRPIAVTFTNGSGQTVADRYSTTVAAVQRFNAQITGGSDPLEVTWGVKRPGGTYYIATTTGVSNNGRTFQYAPSATGTYGVRAWVRQPGSNLPTGMRTVTIDVTNYVVRRSP
jgi:hypothetical protein